MSLLKASIVDIEIEIRGAVVYYTYVDEMFCMQNIQFYLNDELFLEQYMIERKEMQIIDMKTAKRRLRNEISKAVTKLLNSK